MNKCMMRTEALCEEPWSELFIWAWFGTSLSLEHRSDCGRIALPHTTNDPEGIKLTTYLQFSTEPLM